MRIFEFHFNPKGEKDLIFDSFCYEPATNYEKRMGSLYMTGLLGNILPKQKRFLDNLAENIKENYYKTTANKPGKSLRETLKKANIFLENISKTGDVSWLGNLSFAALSLKSLELNFTKVGDFKIILLRKGQVIDIDQKLKFEGIEPYPLKVFGNIVSGKLAENDVLLVLTKEIFDFLKSRKTLHILAQLAIPTPSKDNPKESIDPQKIKDFFNEKKESFFKIPGLALLILLTKNQTPKERETLTEKRSFSLKKAFSFPIFNNLKRRVVSFKSQKVTIKKTSPGLTLPKKPRPSILKLKAPKLTIPRLNFPKFNLPRINLPKIEIKRSNPLKVFREKKVVLILTLFFLLILGYFVFEGRKQEQMKEYQEEINLIAEKVNQAETFLIVAKTNPQAEIKANSLFQESWQDLSPILNIASTFPQDLAN